MSRYIANRYSIQFNALFTHFYSVSTVNLKTPINYWTQNHSGLLTIFLPKGFEINTNVAYTWQEASSTFSNNNSVLLWNASLNKTFSHNRLMIHWQINDILGQNPGITRNIAANQVSQTTTNVVGRYWLVSGIYRFKNDDKVNH